NSTRPRSACDGGDEALRDAVDPEAIAGGQRALRGDVGVAEDSVCDVGNKVWGAPNLFVAGGSCFPTQGAANPALAIMAVASRLAELLGRKQTGGRADARARGLGKAGP